MKICYCIKTDPSELAAIKTTIDILNTLEDDRMVSESFNYQYRLEICDIRSWMDDVLSFITDFGN